MNDIFKRLTLPGADAAELKPSFVETIGSAFNLENDVANLYAHLNKPVFQPDPTFNFMSEFKKRQLPVDWMVPLAGSQSVQEFDTTLSRMQKEYQDRAVLAASGWKGTAAAFAAGMLSPTVFIPIAGQARGAKGMSQILALAAAGATAQNGALFLNQEIRSEAELYAGIALDTALLGLMGAAYLRMTRPARAQVQAAITLNQKKVDVPVGEPDLPILHEQSVRVEAPTAAEVKMEARAAGIRDPEQVAEMMDEAEPMTYVPLKDRALTIGQPKRVKAKDIETQMAYGGSYLEAPVAEDVMARFVKVPVGSGGKWFVGGEYAITLHRADGTEITLPLGAVDTHMKAGRTPYFKEAELKEALANGELDDQLYTMLEAAEDPGMARSTMETPISKPADNGKAADTQAIGAAPSRTRNTLGPKPAPNRVSQALMNMLGKMSPSYRMFSQRLFPSLRNGIAKLDNSGIQQAGLEQMQPSADGGTVIERIRAYDAYVVSFAKKLDQHYYDYVYDGAKGADMNMAAFTQIRSQFGKIPPGKLNWTEYKAAVFEQLNTGEIKPELAPAVQEFKKFFEFYNNRHKQYLAEMEAKGIEVEPLYKELLDDDLGPDVKNYAHHIFDQQKLMENFSQFLEDFGKAYEKSLQESFDKGRKTYLKRKEKLEFEQLISQLDDAEISTRLADTEAEIEFLDETPELQGFNTQRLALNKQAKEEGWPKEQLKAAQKDLADSITADTRLLLDERKRLLGVARALKKFGGDATERTTKLRAELDRTNELIAEMFRTELPKIAAVDLNIEKIQLKGDKALAPLTRQMTKVVKEMEKRTAAMQKLIASKRKNPVSGARLDEQMARSLERHQRLLDRIKAVEGQQVALDQRLRELQLLREDVISDATLLVRSRAVRAEATEEKLEAAAAKIIPPEEKLRMRDQIGRELEDLEADFRNTWSLRGENSGDPIATTTPNFREKALEMATMLHQKLTNTEVELSPAYHALRQDARGAELMRVMNIPFGMKKKWLINDVELVTRAYDRTMAPDLEIWRAFDGSVNGKSLLGEMAQEATALMTRIGSAKYVKLPKGWVDKSAAFADKVKKRLDDFGAMDELHLEEKNFSDTMEEGFVELTPELRTQLGNYVSNATKAMTRDFDVAIQRLRMTRGVPRDGTDPWWRAGRFIKNVNVVTMMGGVVTSSISDVARPVWQHGVGRVFRHGWAPFINKLDPKAKEFRLKSKEINRQIGLNLEPVLHSRAQAVFDLAEDSIGRTRLERGANVLAQKMGLVALYDFWTAGMKTIAGNVTHATMAAYVPAVAKAWREGAEFSGDLLQMRTYLRNLGLSDLDIHKIALQMERPDGVEVFSNGGVLPNVHLWDDPAAYQAYQAAVLGEVNKLIVTPGLERPNWTDENMGFSMLAQFKSFTFASNSRMAMSALQGNDPYLMQGIAFSLALGALSYYTYAMTVGGKTLETANQMEPDKWIWEAVKRSGILGAASIAADVGAEMPLITGDDTPVIFRRPGGMLGTLLGPTYSQAERMAGVLTNLDAEDQSRNMRAIRQMIVPYQNHFIFRQLFDRVGDAMYGDN
jgi:hypothetical protein